MSFQDVSQVLSANGSFTVAKPGHFIFVKSVTGAIKIELDGKTFEMQKGDEARPVKPFASFRITDMSGAANTVTLIVGTGEFKRLELTGEVSLVNTGLDSLADVSLVAAATTQISAANANRREIIIKNLSTNTQIFRIGDSGAGLANGHELLPGETITITTQAAVHGYNPGAGAESVTVVEVT